MTGVSKPKRRKIVTASSLAASSELPPDLTSLSRREIIARYHVIKKQLAMVDKSPQFPNEASREARRQVLRAQLALIGIERYQNASREGEARGGGFDSSLWVMKELPRHGCKMFKRVSALSLLDVGAIAHRFPDELKIRGETEDTSGSAADRRISLRVTSIDLNPEDSEAGRKVIKADFFDFARKLLRERAEKFGVICLSLCVNFEGCAKRRGEMIHLASKLLGNDGLLFLVLPRACVENSRYCDEKRFHQILNATGMGVLSTTYTLKLMQCVSEKQQSDNDTDAALRATLSRREFVRKGSARNNFAVVLDPTLLDSGSPGGSENDLDSMESVQTRRGNKRKTGQVSAIRKEQMTSNQRKRARRQARRMQKRTSLGAGREAER